MSYGRNFEFRIPPQAGNRHGRYFLNWTSAVPIGAPVVVNAGAALNALGQQEVMLATGEQAKPVPGQGGVLVFEHAPNAFAENDPVLTRHSDLDTAANGASVQVVNGPYAKVLLRNTSDETFLQTRSYTGRIMVAGLGATSIAVGDYLTPGAGNDDDGYWTETSTAANAWLVVTKVDDARSEVEAVINF